MPPPSSNLDNGEDTFDEVTLMQDEWACNVQKKRVAYDIAQADEYAKYMIAGPPVFTVATHMGQDKDEDIRGMHMALHDLLGNNGVTKKWIDKDFIVNDPNVPDQIRTMNSKRGRFQIYLIKNDEIVHDKFMEISDFCCHEWIDISSVMIMKTNLDTLMGR